MLDLMDFLVIAGMFVLRIGVPLVVILGLGYLLKRLDRRWEEEAREEREERVPAREPRPGQRPVRDMPGIQIPFDPDLGRYPLPGLVAAPRVHCWDIKSCTEAMRAGCPGCKDANMPCWLARTRMEGKTPSKCIGCEIFNQYPRDNLRQYLQM